MKTHFVAAIFVAFGVLSGCTSISCKYAPPDSTDQLPTDLRVGMTLETKLPLVGLLDESIDDPSIHYLNVVIPPGYQNRFVKQRVRIPAGTKLQILGYRRPFSPFCRSHDWTLVLGSGVQLTPGGDEIRMRFPLARNSEFIAR